MANKKINQLDTRTGAALTDLVLIGDPTSGTSFKLTATDFRTLLNNVPYTGATGNVNLGEFGLSAGQLTLDTTPTGTAAVGTTRWNDTIGSSETTLKGGSVILKNGVDLVARVVNKVSPNTTLTKAAYQAVRVSGAQGQRLAVAFAQANNDANSADTIGLVTETIATNQEGFIITVGQLENINTTGSLQGETWADGDVLYLSPFTPGAITKVKPTGNGHIVVIGYVEYAHQNNGKIYVKVMNGWELDELHDVNIVSPANNEALIYESSTALWKNKTIASALGYTPISGTGATGQVAYWNGTNSQTGSNNLFWDAANSRLGIGTATPSATLHTVGSITAASAIARGNYMQPTLVAASNNDVLVGLDVNPTFTNGAFTGLQNLAVRVTGPAGVGTRGIINIAGYDSYGQVLMMQPKSSYTGLLYAGFKAFGDAGGAMGFGVNFVSNNPVNFGIYSEAGQAIALFNSTRNVLIQNGGTFTDGGQRLQVYGDAFVRGSGATSATSSLVVQDSASTTLLNVRNDGQIFMQANKIFNSDTIKAVSSNLSFESFNSALHIRLAGGVNNTTAGVVIGNANNITLTTGFRNSLAFDDNFTPTSGTSIRNYIYMGFTINQTGGANGITRGLYVNPTLTAAADWRSIEWSNNSGWGLYGAGTAPNFINGSLLLGSVSNTGERLQVTGTMNVTGASTFGADMTLTLNQNAVTGFTIINNNNGAAAASYFRARTTNNATYFDFVKVSNSATPYKIIAANDALLYNAGSAGDIAILNDWASGRIKFAAGASSTAQMTLTAAGRLLLGTTTEGTFLLDVNGTARVSGASTFGGNMTLSLNQNSNTSLTVSNTTTGTFAVSEVVLQSNTVASFGKTSSSYATFKTIVASDVYIYNAGAGDITMLNNFSSGNIKFTAGGSSTVYMTIKSNGSVRYQPMATPGTAQAGDVYYDSTSNKLRCYDGTTWNDLF